MVCAKYFKGDGISENSFKGKQECLQTDPDAVGNGSLDTFYDIHLHAFNLSHPYLRAFLDRFDIDKTVDSAIRKPVFGFVTATAVFLEATPGI